jgi:hypothetical protein
VSFEEKFKIKETSYWCNLCDNRKGNSGYRFNNVLISLCDNCAFKVSKKMSKKSLEGKDTQGE